MSAIVGARSSSRDKKRVSDLAQIEFALNAYKEVNKSYPEFDGEPEAIEDEGSFYSLMSTYWESTIVDPFNDDTYKYYYDENFQCDEKFYIAVIVNNMESPKNSNFDKVCLDADESSDDFGDNPFVVLIDGPFSEATDVPLEGIETGNAWWDEEENQTWGNFNGLITE